MIRALFYQIENDFVYCCNMTGAFVCSNDFTENKGSFRGKQLIQVKTISHNSFELCNDGRYNPSYQIGIIRGD